VKLCDELELGELGEEADEDEPLDVVMVIVGRFDPPSAETFIVAKISEN
jgi:hypothetical protein